MTIRSRLTAFVTGVTALIVVLATWQGVRMLEDQVSEQALEAKQAELLAWTRRDSPPTASDAPIDTDDDLTTLIRELFGTDSSEPAIQDEVIEGLFDEFGDTPIDSSIYVSALGLAPRSSSASNIVWSIHDSRTIGAIKHIDELPTDVVVLPALTVLDLVRYEDPDDILIETPVLDFEFVTDGAFSDEHHLVFETIVVDDVSYGLVADIADELSAVEGTQWVLQVAGFALTCLAGIATWRVVGMTLAPVEALRTRLDEISTTAVGERLPVAATTDELARLAVTMNQMLERLEVSEQKRRQFISDASHELRTPLAILLGQAEQATRNPDSVTVPEIAALLKDESQRLSTIVSDLLALARHDEKRPTVGDGKHPLSAPAFDLDDVLLAEANRPRRLPVDRSGVSAGRVAGDAAMAARAIGHLLDNASRHGATNVAVGLTSDEERVFLTVDDDGAGIPVPRRDEVFERFTRLDDARERDQGGAGLGLAVVKATFEVMGGSVAVSDSPLGGARFTVVLPQYNDPGPAGVS